MKEYDVVIIGGGVTGGSVAWHLSHYDVKVLLLEKCADGGMGVTKANSGIVHGGYSHATTALKTKLEVRSIPMFDRLQAELHFPFKRCGIMVIAYAENELEKCHKLFDQGIANGIKGMEWCEPDRLLELEPKLPSTVAGGFLVPQGGVIEPTAYCMRMLESAQKNGVDIAYDSKVTGGEFTDGKWQISVAGQPEKICCKYVVNAAGLYADEISKSFGAEEYTIHPRKGEEYLLDRNSAARPEHVIFPMPTEHSKGVLVIPTVGGTTMIGPTADIVDEKEEDFTSSENFKRIVKQVKGMISGIAERDVISSFAGLRPVLIGSEDFYIAYSEKVPQFIQAAGIQSPGLTASPAIGEYITGLLKDGGLTLSPSVAPRWIAPAVEEARECTPERLAELHKENPAWGEFVCRCEKITEAEIVDAVRHGHITVDGVKFYTRAGMGRCQGGFCQGRILHIISRETGIPLEELTKKGGNSYLLSGRLGDLKVKGNEE